MATHRMSKTPLYKRWLGMRNRCRNPRDTYYHLYGGRGIQVCARWDNFEAFLEDVGSPPSSRHRLDRIDNDGGYEPGNVRWTTEAEQQRNRRDNIRITFNGRTQVLEDWAREIGIGRSTLRKRIKELGWSVDEALTTPVQEKDRAYLLVRMSKAQVV